MGQDSEIQALIDELNIVPRTDFLTKDYRRVMVGRIHNEILRFQRSKRHFAVILAEITNLDEIRQVYGEEVGEQVLNSTGKHFLKVVREMDAISRWGDGQLLLLIIEIEPDDALYLGDRLRQILERKSFIHEGKELELQVNIGVALYENEADSVPVILTMVDDALQMAKDHGGNRVVIFSSDEEEQNID